MKSFYICDRDADCCNYKTADKFEDIEQQAENCGHLIEVAEVKHGYWKVITYGAVSMYDSDYLSIECSECGTEYDREAVRNIQDSDDCFEYCPHCGAKMDGNPDGVELTLEFDAEVSDENT